MTGTSHGSSKKGKFKNKVQFMYGGDLQKVEFLFEAPSPESVLDRLPTAEIKEVRKEASSGRSATMYPPMSEETVSSCGLEAKEAV